MVSRYLDYSPPVAAAMKAGCPVVALETATFCRLPYPQSLRALQDAEQALWQRSCVPCSLAVLGGRLKAGLSPAEADFLCRNRAACSRGELPLVAARAQSAAVLPSAALAMATLADVLCVVLPSFVGDVQDVDALTLYDRLAFCGPLSDDVRALLAARSVPVCREDTAAVAELWLIQRELDAPEAALCSCGSAVSSQCSMACDAAMLLAKSL